MNKHTDVTLSSGMVMRCKPVSHLAISVAVGAYPGCQMPDAPTEEIDSKAAGVTNIVLARPGTPQYAAYQAECNKVMELKERIEDEARYYAGTIGWKTPGKTTFTRQVPKSWRFPQVLTDLGITPKEIEMVGRETVGRTWDYILYELLTNDRDLIKVGRVAYGTDTTGALTDESQEPVTEQEVQAVADKFPGEKEGAAAS